MQSRTGGTATRKSSKTMLRSRAEPREEAKRPYDRRVDWRVLEHVDGGLADVTATLRRGFVRRRVRKGPLPTPRSWDRHIWIEFL